MNYFTINGEKNIMKKWVRGLSIIILIISILLVATIVIFNLIIVSRIMFFVLALGSEYPDTIWWGKKVLYGISGIKTFYSVFGKAIIIISIPISIFCIIYQFIYFKIIRNKL